MASIKTTTTKTKASAKAKAPKYTDAQIKALIEKNRVLTARTKELEQASLINRYNKSEFVLKKEVDHPEIFNCYIETRNSDGSIYKHKFVKTKTVSKFNVEYYTAHKFFTSKKDLDAQRTSSTETVSPEPKTVQSVAKQDVPF